MVGDVCDRLMIESFIYEDDAVASDDPPKVTWERELAPSDLFICLVWKKFGTWTESEFEFARESNIPVLLFVKAPDVDGDGEPDIASTQVQEFLNRQTDVESGISDAWFGDAEELERKLTASILNIQALGLDARKRQKMNDGAPVQGASREAVESDGGHGEVVVESARPGAKRRKPRRLKRHRGLFFGRGIDRDVVATLIGQDEPFVALKGEKDIGREALLQVLANEDLKDAYPDGVGVIADVADGAPIDDLRRAIWEAFYDDGGIGADEDRELSDLETLHAMIAMLDIDLDEETVEELEDLVPEALVAATLPATSALDRGSVHELRPIDDAEALLEAFTTYAGVDVAAEHVHAVVERCRATGGAPGDVKDLCQKAMAELKRTSLQEWLAGGGT